MRGREFSAIAWSYLRSGEFVALTDQPPSANALAHKTISRHLQKPCDPRIFSLLVREYARGDEGDEP
jgi:hypothetical protein